MEEIPEYGTKEYYLWWFNINPNLPDKEKDKILESYFTINPKKRSKLVYPKVERDN